VQTWIAQQHELATRMKELPYPGLPRFIAAADAAFSPDGKMCIAVAVIWDRQKSELVEHVVARRPLEFPYVPTFLSFREGAALQEAIARLKHPWDVICFDGQGFAHPRRCGIATHISVMLDRPAIGIGKSRLCGRAKEPGLKAGAWSPLIHRQQQVGIALRTRDGVKPLFVSVGHRMDIESARRIVLACGRGYRLPEPIRIADRITKVERAK
jgi:deoxyribonuclease V